jgi:hypothetical protein
MQYLDDILILHINVIKQLFVMLENKLNFRSLGIMYVHTQESSMTGLIPYITYIFPSLDKYRMN